MLSGARPLEDFAEVIDSSSQAASARGSTGARRAPSVDAVNAHPSLWTSGTGPVHSNAARGSFERRRWMEKLQTDLRAWTVKDSLELYNVNGWGRDFFSINDAGNVAGHACGPGLARRSISRSSSTTCAAAGSTCPILIRFSDILQDARRAAVRRVPAGDRRERLQGHLPRRLPDQGQPAAPRRRGADRVRPALQPRASRPARSPSCWSRSRCRRTPRR